MSPSKLATLFGLCLLLALATIPASAQDIDKEFEEEFPEQALPYVGLGPGITATFIFMNLDELNKLADAFKVDEFGGPLSVYGGGVVFTPIFVQNIRIAVHAFGGYHRSSRPIRIDSVVYNRTLRFGIRFQGMAGLDYAIPITGRFTVLPGLTAGWGSYALEFTQTGSPEVRFRDVWDPDRFVNDTAASMSNFNRSVRMLNYHAFVFPVLQLEYAITGSLMVRGSVGYHYGLFDDDWTNEAETSFTDVPNISANGPAFQVGVYLGLFQQ
jgi:hypothetical protein